MSLTDRLLTPARTPRLTRTEPDELDDPERPGRSVWGIALILLGLFQMARGLFGDTSAERSGIGLDLSGSVVSIERLSLAERATTVGAAFFVSGIVLVGFASHRRALYDDRE